MNLIYINTHMFFEIVYNNIKGNEIVYKMNNYSVVCRTDTRARSDC